MTSPSVLEQLIGRIRQAAVYNRHDLAKPSVVLWTDGERAWSKVIHRIRDAMPELLILAGEADDERSGPSTWIRYRLVRTDWTKTPVLYLPGVPRHAFRGAAGFPEPARHLFALQYQGQFWNQANGKDWTPSAFLSSQEGGLSLDLARDRATLDALAAQLAHVLRAPVVGLQGRHLEAADFHGLAASDPVGLLLEWVASGDGEHADWAPERWTAFRALCKDSFGLDPEKDGIITAVEHLVEGGGIWDQAWKRYREAHKAFAGVHKSLDLVQPKDLLDATNDRLPSTNRKQEDTLRHSLAGLSALPKSEALAKLGKLCAENAPRARSLWADLGEAPLAQAALHLKTMAEGIKGGNLGHDWATLGEGYLAKGWSVDNAAWRAYAAVRDAPDVQAVTSTLRAVYLPWLESLAEQTHTWAAGYPTSEPADTQTLEPTPGTVVVFVDGLRCDLGVELKRLLESQGLAVEIAAHWAALPTVTATAKPAWRPLADTLVGNTLPEGFEPQTAHSGSPVKTPVFRHRLAELGWTWLDPAAIGEPGAAAWTEIGTFDHDGHAQGARLAWRLEDELRAVAHRIRDLLQAGWQRAVVVTDHGWLLMPGGLPKVDLPAHLTQSRWPRCAVPQPGVQHGFSEVPWFWGGEHGVVLAPGISAFKAGVEYTHGGLSPQEALTPRLIVTSVKQAAGVEIVSAEWKGLRLRVQLQGGFTGTQVDIRTKAADAGASVLDAERRMQQPAADGTLTLLVADDSLEGAAAMLVVVRDGQVVAKRPVTIGGD